MGAAIYIDVIAIFLWKCMVRILQLIRSSGWERKLAVVKNVRSSSAATPGCPVVKVTYDVTGVGEQYQDSSEIPFLFIGSAQEYARAVPFQSAIRVRVDPRNLEKSLYFDKDQKSTIQVRYTVAGGS